MNLFGIMEISGSALQAQRVRAEVTATNMANAETTRTADGGAYQRQTVVLGAQQDNFSSSLFPERRSLLPGGNLQTSMGGVDVVAIQKDINATVKRYDPGHPDADSDGYVEYPDINPLTEMVDLMGATRSYGLNASALQAEKGMLSASLDILK